MPLLGALVIKEFQTWLRARLAFAFFGAVVVLLAAMTLILSLAVLAPDGNAAPSFLSGQSPAASVSSNLIIANRALFLFGAASLCLLLTGAVVSATVAASAFAAERERGTLDLLLLQGPTTIHLVLGKLIAAWLFSLLVLLVSAPLFAGAWSFGGVTGEPLIAFGAVLLTSTLFFSALGVFFASLVRGALLAAIFSQALVVFCAFGSLGLYLALVLASGSSALRPLLWLNPLIAPLSSGGLVTDAFVRGVPPAYRGALSLPATAFPFANLPAWAVSSICFMLLAVLFSVAASVAIDPCHPLRRIGRHSGPDALQPQSQQQPHLARGTSAA